MRDYLFEDKEIDLQFIETLKFDEKGLIPAIVVDAESKKVLTLAYMNRESLEISIKKELTCFYSRSRQELWLKGETSGNYQHIVSITADCDNDALVVVVEKDGPACHTGSDSCFTKPVYESPNRTAFSADGLYELLADRKETLPEDPIRPTSLKRASIRSSKRWARSRPKSSLRPRAMTRRRPFTRSPIWPITSW